MDEEELQPQETVEAVVKKRRSRQKKAIKENKEKLSEYEYFDADTDEPILISEQDKDAWIGSPKVRKKITNPNDILSKDLRMSFIDKELAYIFGLQLECVEEWNNHGMPHLSLRRAVHLTGQLSLFASVDGKERIMQGKPSISFDAQINELRKLRDQMIPNDSSDQEKKSFFRR